MNKFLKLTVSTMQQQLVLLFLAVPPASSSGIAAVSVALSAIAPSNQSVVSLTVALSNQFVFTGGGQAAWLAVAQSNQFVVLLTVTPSDQFPFTGVGLAALLAVELNQG